MASCACTAATAALTTGRRWSDLGVDFLPVERVLEIGSAKGVALLLQRAGRSGLSGLYGALRPLDRLQPYRLKMGTALKTRHGKDLYGYWGDTVAALIDERLAGVKAPLVVNLASAEYAKVALRPALRARVVDCVFEDWKDGRYKVIGFHAKHARGAMARHAILARAQSLRALQGFAGDGYAFDAGASKPDRLVFRRRG